MSPSGSRDETASDKSETAGPEHYGEWDPSLLVSSSRASTEPSSGPQTPEPGNKDQAVGHDFAETPTRRAKRKCIQELGDKFLAEKLQREWRAVGSKARAQEPQPQVKHLVSRTKEGYMVADVRRGCCLCAACARSLSKEITTGSGLVILRGALDQATVERTREAIIKLEEESHAVRSGELGEHHVRTWDLINQGSSFVDLATNENVFKVVSLILGKDFVLGSLSANHLRPGCPSGPTHVDYPYSKLLSTSFPKESIGTQATFCLDAFNEDTGGTQVQLHSQLNRAHPDRDFEPSTTVEAAPGDIFIYHGLLHHRSGANRSKTSRIGVLAQFLVRYARPMEEQLLMPPSNKHRQSSNKRLRQLLAVD